MRDGAPRIGRPRRRNAIVDHQAEESEFGVVSHLKNALSIESRGARKPETFPKAATYCHLLPFCNRKIGTPVRTISFGRRPSRARRPA